MPPVGSDLIAAVMATADAFLRESQRLFRPYGLTGAQYNVLNVLEGAAQGMSQRELSEVLVVDRSNVTGLLDRMEKAGWFIECRSRRRAVNSGQKFTRAMSSGWPK
jgi:MarR family 2-MHQ and catechol resistance regulon transcriptional repressor